MDIVNTPKKDLKGNITVSQNFFVKAPFSYGAFYRLRAYET